MNEYYVGLDIGGTKCAVLLGKADENLRIEIIEKRVFATESERGPEYTIDRLEASISDILAGTALCPVAIGISCGGPLDSKRGIILSPPNLPGWDEVYITERLENRFGISAYLQNDANACALVEWKLGAGRGCDNMVFLTMGTGMGAGIIAEGRLVRGANDMAGEVGHIRLENDGPEGYGKAGSFEGFASGGGIARHARETIPESWRRARAADGNEVTTRDIARAAMEGDAVAIAHFERTGEMLGVGISYILDILNPERIVIGSIFTRCEGLLRPAMERAIAREALPHTAGACRIVCAEAGENIGDFAGIMTAVYSATP